MNGPLIGTWMIGTEIDGSVVAGINKPMSKGWTTLLAPRHQAPVVQEWRAPQGRKCCWHNNGHMTGTKIIT